jgi:hypothetical protein
MARIKSINESYLLRPGTISIEILCAALRAAIYAQIHL